MRLFSGLYAGREALMTHGAAMAVSADNISNSNTPAYKNRRAEFATLLASAQGGMFDEPLGTLSGVLVESISTSHDIQGALEDTGRELDMAIQGKGFFIINDGTTDYYTRAGNFVTDADGYIATVTGDNLLGYTTESPDAPVAINVRTVETGASPTTTMTVGGNLDAEAAIVDPINNPATFFELNEAASFAGFVRVIDSLGASHEIGLYAYHTDALTWQVQAYVDGGEIGGTEGAPTLLGTTNLTFQGDGTQAADADVAMEITPAWSNGATQGAINMGFGYMVGQAANSNLSSLSADGRMAGTVEGLRIDRDGTVNALLNNGEEYAVATLALADFRNPQGLEGIGDNRYAAHTDSGDPMVGLASTDSRGFVRGGALETSNVDLAKEFVNIIRYQRGYQAGSKVMSTVDEMLTTTMQIA